MSVRCVAVIRVHTCSELSGSSSETHASLVLTARVTSSDRVAGRQLSFEMHFLDAHARVRSITFADNLGPGGNIARSLPAASANRGKEVDIDIGRGQFQTLVAILLLPILLQVLGCGEKVRVEVNIKAARM